MTTWRVNQLELVLHKLGVEPFVLASTGGGGLTIIEALEREIVEKRTRVDFGIVLMTPDDKGYAERDGSRAIQPRARQNVVLEMGMMLAALGRPRVVVLRKGHLEPPSDAAGIIYIPFQHHVRETVPKLVDRLRAVGFELDPDAITRASS
jgi:predicted nucleotide-binding protein